MKTNISDSEMKVMEKIWDCGEMISVADVVALLNEDGESWTHQTVGTFLKRLDLVGNKKYEVTEDYELHYLGIDETVKIDNITDITRGTSIPTRKGTLPNSGTYKMSNYIYSNRYFNLGNSGGLNESIGVTISADQEQDIMVSWMDGRNDESMGDHTYYFNRPNEVTKYDWVDSGQDFYFKFTNKMGSKTISGSYEIFMD